MRLKLYAEASAEWQRGWALWQRFGWALQDDPRHFPQAWAVLRQLAEADERPAGG